MVPSIKKYILNIKSDNIYISRNDSFEGGEKHNEIQRREKKRKREREFVCVRDRERKR